MPRPSESPSDSDPAAALLLWLIRDGTATLVTTIREQIVLVQQAVLLWLARCHKRLTPKLVSPLWQWAHAAVMSLLQSRVAAVCWRLMQSWLGNLKAVRRRLDSPPTDHFTQQTDCSTQSHSKLDRLTPRDDKLQDSFGPSGNASPVNSTVSGKNSSPHGSPDSVRRSPLTAPPRRESLAGNWSSVSFPAPLCPLEAVASLCGPKHLELCC